MQKEILTVNEFLASLRVAKPQSYKNLTILPLMSNKTKDLKLKTLQEALKEDTVEITEVQDGAVPFLLFFNKGNNDILVLSGAIVTGNLQDRTVRSSFILHPQQEAKISVACVEESRWHSRGQKGSQSRYHLASGGHHRIRIIKYDRPRHNPMNSRSYARMDTALLKVHFVVFATKTNCLICQA